MEENINSSNKEKMHKSKTKQAIGWFLLGTAILFIGVALMVHIFSPKIDSLITEDGMLSYVISCISSAATVGLAYVAYRQTERANSMAEITYDSIPSAVISESIFGEKIKMILWKIRIKIQAIKRKCISPRQNRPLDGFC